MSQESETGKVDAAPHSGFRAQMARSLMTAKPLTTRHLRALEYLLLHLATHRPAAAAPRRLLRELTLDETLSRLQIPTHGDVSDKQATKKKAIHKKYKEEYQRLQAEALGLANMDELIESQLLERIRALKYTLGPAFLDRALLKAHIQCFMVLERVATEPGFGTPEQLMDCVARLPMEPVSSPQRPAEGASDRSTPTGPPASGDDRDPPQPPLGKGDTSTSYAIPSDDEKETAQTQADTSDQPAAARLEDASAITDPQDGPHRKQLSVPCVEPDTLPFEVSSDAFLSPDILEGDDQPIPPSGSPPSSGPCGTLALANRSPNLAQAPSNDLPTNRPRSTHVEPPRGSRKPSAGLSQTRRTQRHPPKRKGSRQGQKTGPMAAWKKSVVQISKVFVGINLIIICLLGCYRMVQPDLGLIEDPSRYQAYTVPHSKTMPLLNARRIDTLLVATVHDDWYTLSLESKRGLTKHLRANLLNKEGIQAIALRDARGNPLAYITAQRIDLGRSITNNQTLNLVR